MGRKKKEQEDNTSGTRFPKKWEKLLPKTFKEDSEKLSNEELKAKVVEYQQTISSTEKQMENDQELINLKEEKKEAEKDYKNIISQHDAMSRYIVFLLETRGNI